MVEGAADGQKKRDQPQKPKQGGGPEGSPGAPDSELIGKGESLFAAAKGSIDKALSGNSEDFLKANRQSGGQ